MKRPLPGFIAGLLVAVSPSLLPGLGTAVSWTTAWVWLALAQAVRHPKRPLWLFLGLLLFTWLGFDSLIFVGLICLLALFPQQRWARLVGFLSLGVSVLGAVFWRADSFERIASTFAQYDQFLWLLLPMFVAGLWALFIESQEHPVLIAALVWPVLALLWGTETAVAAVTVLGFFLIGLGIARIIDWFENREFIRLKEPGYAQPFSWLCRFWRRRLLFYSRIFSNGR